MRVLLFLFTLLICSSLIAQDLNSAHNVEIFEAAKSDFLDFEREHGGFLQTQNINLHYLEWGNPDHTPLIWIHGSFSSSYELKDVVGDLVQHQYYVIAIDYYGHGQTKIPQYEVSLYHVADDIKELMDAKKIEKAVIGGWSRGGIIATAFYDEYPERILGLILEDGGSVSTNAHYHKMTEKQLTDRVDLIITKQFKIPAFNSEIDAFYFLYDADFEGNQFEIFTWLTQNEYGKWTIGSGLWQLFHMSSKKELLETILRPTKANLFGESMSIIEPKIIYRNLDVPMLILDPVSEEDIFPYEQENQELYEQHKGLIIYKKFEHTGHNIHYERPSEFVLALVAFREKIVAFWSK